MVGAEDDCRIGPGEIEQSLEHHVVETVSTFYDILINGEVFVLYPLQLRRVVGHEGVREMIDPVVIDRGEIPWLVLHQRGRDCVDGGVIAQDFGKRTQTLVLLLIDLRRVGNEGQDMGLR